MGSLSFLNYNMKNKLTIFIDMDGVLADFESAAKLLPPEVKRPDLALDF